MGYLVEMAFCWLPLCLHALLPSLVADMGKLGQCVLTLPPSRYLKIAKNRNNTSQCPSKLRTTGKLALTIIWKAIWSHLHTHFQREVVFSASFVGIYGMTFKSKGHFPTSRLLITSSNLHNELKKKIPQVIKDLYEYGVFYCPNWPMTMTIVLLFCSITERQLVWF